MYYSNENGRILVYDVTKTSVCICFVYFMRHLFFFLNSNFVKSVKYCNLDSSFLDSCIACC